MHHHLALASITSKGANVNITNLYEGPLGSEADLANISFSLSKVLLILQQSVLKVSPFEHITARFVDKYLLLTFSIATLP